MQLPLNVSGFRIGNKTRNTSKDGEINVTKTLGDLEVEAQIISE